MRVFRRIDEQGENIIEVWDQSDCLPCPCSFKGNCQGCEAGYVRPFEETALPLRCEPFEKKISAQAAGIHGGTYRYVAHGNYNLAYRSLDQRWILKIPIQESNATDFPERAVRIWNVINPGYPAQVMYDQERMPIAWFAPFIQGTRPTQEEVAQKILEIYEKTGRIVADAFVMANFVKTVDGSIVCIDVGAAFFLESRPSLARSHSQVSLETWNGNVMFNPASSIYRAEFAKRSAWQVIVDVTKALLYLQMKRPDFRFVSAMLKQGSLINLLASSYDKKSTRSEEALTCLDAYMASCGYVNVQSRSNVSAAAAAVAIKSAPDDGYCEAIPLVDESGAKDQDDQQPVVVSENISLCQ